MWHVSVAQHGRNGPVPPGDQPDEHRQRAERALSRAGDADLGEWWEHGRAAVHLRRRCSWAEVLRYGLVVRDVRGTPEATARLAPVARWLPPGYTEG